jgi:hypothetical protein
MVAVDSQRQKRRLCHAAPSAAILQVLPNAEFRALPPGRHAALDSSLATETMGFVCGQGHFPASERVLATVLITDIVGSTEQLSSQGDARWRHQLDVHDHVVDRTLSKYGWYSGHPYPRRGAYRRM